MLKPYYLLLRIISAIEQNANEQPTYHVVTAMYQDTVLVGLHELVVEEQQPKCLHELRFAETKHLGSGWNAMNALVRVLYLVGKLQIDRKSGTIRK